MQLSDLCYYVILNYSYYDTYSKNTYLTEENKALCIEFSGTLYRSLGVI